MNSRILIYTAITGGYDLLQQPAFEPHGFDFVCFVSRGMKKSEFEGVWKIEEIPYGWDDNTLLSRSQKMNPHTVLPEGYDYSVWMDGNIRILDESFFDVCRALRDEGVLYAGVKHPFRDCVFEEIPCILRDRRESLRTLLSAVTFLRRHHMPEHYGLMETNIIFRQHNHPDVVEFDRWWWECFLNFPRRDQLTQNFALWDTAALNLEYRKFLAGDCCSRVRHFFKDGMSARNFPGLEYLKHPSPALGWAQRKLKYGMNKPELLILRGWIALSRLIWNPHKL